MENNNEIFEEKVEQPEELAPEKKKLPWWIFAIIGAGVVAIVAVVLIIVLGGKCEHIDKNDDFLCDECGAEFDDGLEIITSTVTLEFKDEAGASMSGIKLTVKNSASTYALESGADGKATVTLPVGAYEIEYDYSTIPSGFQPDLSVLRVKEDTTSVAVTVVDNNPNGSLERPYLVADYDFAITVPAGEELYYSCRVADARKMKVEGESIVVVYGEEEYEDGEEFIIINETTDVNFMAVFSVKNTSDADIETKILTVFDPGTLENPFIAEGNEIAVHLEKGQIVYYKWTSTVDCLLIVSKSENKCGVSLSKIKIVDDQEIPVYSETGEDGKERLDAFVGEEIIIRISNESSDAIDVTLTLTAKLGE